MLVHRIFRTSVAGFHTKLQSFLGRPQLKRRWSYFVLFMFSPRLRVPHMCFGISIEMQTERSASPSVERRKRGRPGEPHLALRPFTKFSRRTTAHLHTALKLSEQLWRSLIRETEKYASRAHLFLKKITDYLLTHSVTYLRAYLRAYLLTY